MDTGKVPFGSEIWLVIDLSDKICCDKCKTLLKKLPKITIVKGYYCSMNINHRIGAIEYYAEYFDDFISKWKKVLIKTKYFEEILDSEFVNDDSLEVDESAIYSKDVDICEQDIDFEEAIAFHSEEDANNFIKEYAQNIFEG